MGDIRHDFWVQDFDRSGCGSPIYEHPLPRWFTRPDRGRKSMKRYLDRAWPRNAIVVLYHIPDRDMGQHSKGGAVDYEEYMDWIETMVDEMRGYDPIVIYEPDALAHCAEHDNPQRLAIMKIALERLCTVSDKVYVDIGHSNWLDVGKAIELLHAVHNPGIRGFSVNVSNFQTTNDSLAYAQSICENSMVYKYYVIDTSRNGNGPDGDNEWCNPLGRKVGEYPRIVSEIPGCDAYLWIKIPGESDGKCNGGPKAGRWYLEYAERLLK